MKKVIQFFALFVCVCGILTGCDKSTNTGDSAMTLTLSTNTNSIVAGSEVVLTVSASSEVEAPLVVNLTSDNASVTVPATITIETGKSIATVAAKGISKGNAKVTIAAEGVKYLTQSVDITVTEVTADTPVLKIEVASTSVVTGAKVPFLITASVAPKSDLTINLTSDKPEFVTAPASVVLKSGALEVEGELTAVALGKAAISVSAVGAVVPAALEITVGNPDKIAKLYATEALNLPKVPYASFVCESNKYGKVYPGCLYAHDYDKAGGTPTGIKKSTIDYYGGSVVGKIAGGEVFITSIPEGTVIDGNLAWQDYYTTYMRFPILVKDGDVTNSLSDGTHFIVVALSDQGDPNRLPNGYDDAVYVPCWMKIKVAGLNIEVLDGAMLLDDKQEFKVGQK